jgi:hypothetical protein
MNSFVETRSPFTRVIARDFLQLAPEVRPETLRGRTVAEIAKAVETNTCAILVADGRLNVVGLNRKARQAFANVPNVIGMTWTALIRSRWDADAAEDVVAAIENTLDTGTPYSCIDFFGQRIDPRRVERYHWELRRIASATGEPLLLSYFLGPLD